MEKPLTKAGYVEPEQAKDFETVIKEFESSLLRYATRILRDANAAQDVVQNTFIKLHKAWVNGPPHPNPQLSGWLYRVTHNHAVDYIRRESRLRVLHEAQAEQQEARDQEKKDAMAREDAMSLALEHLKTLDLPEQQVVVLRLQEGKSYKEIAEITDRSEGNVGCILHHAVKKLAKSLKQAGALSL